MNKSLKGKLIAIMQTDPWDEGGKLPRGYFRKDIKFAKEGLKAEIKKGDWMIWSCYGDYDSLFDTKEATKELLKLVNKWLIIEKDKYEKKGR